MGLHWIESELQRTGTVQDKAFAEIVGGVLRARGEDVRLPELAVVQFPLAQEQLGVLQEKAKKEGKEVVRYQVWPKSVAQQLLEDKPYFGFVNESEDLRNLVEPVSFEAAVLIAKKTQIAVPLKKSFSLSLQDQQEMVQEYSQPLEHDGIKAIMAHAYVDTQLDIAHQKQTGNKLLVGFYARTPDKTFGSSVADVGRIDSDSPLDVYDWDRGAGRSRVCVLPVVVPANLEI